MRTFLLLLLIANIAYYAWNHGWLSEAPPASEVVVLPSVEPRERAPRQLRLIAELSDSERQELGRVADLAVLGGNGEAFTPDNPSSLQEPVVAGAERSSELQAETEQRVRTPWCGELGLFVTGEDAEALMSSLVKLGFSVELRSGERPVSSTFWVYMPPFADEAEARRMLAELQVRNIDSYHMRSGQFSGGISLGVFSRRSSAETVQAELARQGYQASIGQVFREEPRSWLVLKAPSVELLEGDAWESLKTDFPAPGLSENVCEIVATDN